MSKPYIKIDNFNTDARKILEKIVDIPQDTWGLSGLQYEFWTSCIATSMWESYHRGWRDARNEYDKS